MEQTSNQNESANPESSGNDFLKEVSNPTIPALDTAPPQGPAPVYDDLANSAPPPPPPRKPDEPMFRKEDTTDTGGTSSGAEPEQPKRSADYQDKVIRGLITAEGFISARVLGLAAGTDNVDQFNYKEDEVDTLVTLMEPFKDWIIDRCPAALPLFLVYAGIKTDHAFRVVKIKRTRRENEAAKANPKVKEAVAAAASAEGQKQRTRFAINDKGEYRYDLYGQYLKQEDPKEVAHINDLKQILENNKLSVVMKAFNMTEDQLKPYQQS